MERAIVILVPSSPLRATCIGGGDASVWCSPSFTWWVRKLTALPALCKGHILFSVWRKSLSSQGQHCIFSFPLFIFYICAWRTSLSHDVNTPGPGPSVSSRWRSGHWDSLLASDILWVPEASWEVISLRYILIFNDTFRIPLFTSWQMFATQTRTTLSLQVTWVYRSKIYIWAENYQQYFAPSHVPCYPFQFLPKYV